MILKPLFYTLLCFSLLACSDKTKPNHAPTQKSSKTKPTYRVGMDMNYMPYNFRDEKQRIQGLDVDVIAAIAEHQDFDVEFVLIPYELLLKEWKNQNISIIMDGFAAADLAHDKQLSVSDSYHTSPDCIFANSRENLLYWQYGKLALITYDGINERLLKNNMVKRNQITMVPTVFLAMKEVASGNIQATISDCTALKYLAKSQTFSQHTFFANVFEPSNTPNQSNLVIAVDKDKPELLQKINSGLHHLKQSGQLEKMIEKWQ